MKKAFILLTCTTALLCASCVEDDVYNDNTPAAGGSNNETPAAPIGYSGLVLNELNGNDKFIELYNKGGEALSLKGIYMEKDGKNV